MIKRSLVLFIFLLPGVSGFCQIEMGLRLGANVSRSVFDSDTYKKFNPSKFKIGYQAGVVFVFENPKMEKYALQTEFYYSTIGRKIDSRANDFTENIATYRYIHWPMMFRMRFKSQGFDFYALLGPQVSYWFGGKGVYKVYDPNYRLTATYDYKINFDEPIQDYGYMNVSEYNRLQLGITFGGGVLYEINDVDRVAFDLRYYIGHTFLGIENGGYIPFKGLEDNFESTNHSIELSVIYTFDIYDKLRHMRNKYK